MPLDYRTVEEEGKKWRERSPRRAKPEPNPEEGTRTLFSPPFPSPPDRGTSIRSFIHSFVRSLVLERSRLACIDLPRVAGNLDLQLEGKSIVLDIQSAVSESGSDT